MRFFSVIILVAVLLTAASCSSAPKKPAEIFTLRNIAAGQLELASQMASRGRYSDALLVLRDVQKTVVGVDDPSLIVRTAIVYGNILFSMGSHEEAFAFWESAVKTANDEKEQKLAALARVFTARGRVVLSSIDGSLPATDIQGIRDQMNAEIAVLKGDDLGEAAGWITAGLAEKELSRYAEAENSIRRALAIHEKGVYLEETAYDWFLIASIRSVGGRLDDAITALSTAILFDRRAENGYGAAASWKALGDVYTKKGNTAEAEASYRHAAGIYLAMGLDELAQKAYPQNRD